MQADPKLEAWINPFSVLLLLTAVSLLIYWPLFGYGFIEIDDGGQIFENPLITRLSLSNLLQLFQIDVVGMYQPLTSMVNALLYTLSDGDPSAYRLLSLLLHITNGLLCYRFSERLFAYTDKPSAPTRLKAVVIALLFIVHPLKVESVAWISALSTSWFTLFFLLSMQYYWDYLQQGSNRAYLTAVVLFFIGALFKVQIIPLVGVLILLDLFFAKRISLKHRILNKLPFIATALLFAGIALHFRGDSNAFPSHPYHPWQLLPMQLLWYPYKSLLPWPLGIQYDWPNPLWEVGVILSYLLMLPLAIWAWYKRHTLIIMFGLFFYLGNILLHTALFSQFLGPVADRYAYLSTFGLAIVLCHWFFSGRFSQHRWLLFGWIGFLIALSSHQVRVWQDTLSVWDHNLSHQSATFSNSMRGAIYFQQGELAKARSDFEIFADNPDTRLDADKYNYLYTNLAIMVANESPEKAYDYFKRVLFYSRTPNTVGNVAKIALRLGKTAEAEQLYQEILTQFPQHTSTLNELGNLYFAEQRFAEMLPLLTRLTELEPDQFMHWQKRGFIHQTLQQSTAARADFQTALLKLKRQGVPPQHDQVLQLQQLIDEIGQ